jgi:serine/threonine protein kinase
MTMLVNRHLPGLTPCPAHPLPSTQHYSSLLSSNLTSTTTPAPPTKPRNGSKQLGDFGLATYRDAAGGQHEDANLVGTPHYMSPELLGQKGYSFKSDTWCVSHGRVCLSWGGGYLGLRHDGMLNDVFDCM